MSKLSDPERAAVLRRLDRFVSWVLVLVTTAVILSALVTAHFYGERAIEQQKETRSTLKSLLDKRAPQTEVWAKLGKPLETSNEQDAYKMKVTYSDVWTVEIHYSCSPPRVASIIIDRGAVTLDEESPNPP